MLRASHHALVRRDPSLPSPAMEVVDGDWTLPLLRELVEVPTDDGIHLVAVRKRPLDPAHRKGAVLLVHGLGQNRFSWDLPRRSLANYLVAHGYEVFIADLRGHGLSRANGAPYPDSFEAYVQQDVPALLRKAAALSGESKIFYIGHSLGGTIGYCAGPDVQDRLRGLISLAGPLQFGRGSLLLPSLGLALRTIGRLSPLRARHVLPHLSVDLAGALIRRGLPYFDFPLQLFPLSLWYPRSIESEMLEERIRLGFDRTGIPIAEFMVRWASHGKLISSCGSIDYESELRRLQTPMLLCVGGQDAVVPARSMQAAIERSGSRDKTFRIFEQGPLARGWGHMDLVCGKAAPRVVWPILLDWLDQH